VWRRLVAFADYEVIKEKKKKKIRLKLKSGG
jgi:hypothetical protein